jgi:hypothetical protein
VKAYIWPVCLSASSQRVAVFDDYAIVEQLLRLLQIERVQALGEPAVERSEQFASLLSPKAAVA